MLYVEYISLIRLNKFPVILRELDIESAVIRRFGVGEWLNFAVDSLLILENWYSGIGFWINKYRPTRIIKSRVFTRLFCCVASNPRDFPLGIDHDMAIHTPFRPSKSPFPYNPQNPKSIRLKISQ